MSPSRKQRNERLIAETFLPCETTVQVYDLALGDDGTPVYSVVIDRGGPDRAHSRRISVIGTAALKDLAEMFMRAYKTVLPDNGAPCACNTAANRSHVRRGHVRGCVYHGKDFNRGDR